MSTAKLPRNIAYIRLQPAHLFLTCSLNAETDLRRGAAIVTAATGSPSTSPASIKSDRRPRSLWPMQRGRCRPSAAASPAAEPGPAGPFVRALGHPRAASRCRAALMNPTPAAHPFVGRSCTPAGGVSGDAARTTACKHTGGPPAHRASRGARSVRIAREPPAAGAGPTGSGAGAGTDRASCRERVSSPV